MCSPRLGIFFWGGEGKYMFTTPTIWDGKSVDSYVEPTRHFLKIIQHLNQQCNSITLFWSITMLHGTDNTPWNIPEILSTLSGTVLCLDAIYLSKLVWYELTPINQSYVSFSPLITSFRPIATFCETDNIIWNIPISIWMWGIFCKILSIPHNTTMGFE